ncbi:MAG: hypothetical protein KDH15_16500 [Rhodocyclaceae bacterium]|nr:hypothetical protein [Rhodocyclaceae bacterium]
MSAAGPAPAPTSDGTGKFAAAVGHPGQQRIENGMAAQISAHDHAASWMHPSNVPCSGDRRADAANLQPDEVPIDSRFTKQE